MTELLSFLDELWVLMWYPLQNLSFENIVITCPLLFLILAMLFGMVFKLIGGIGR